MTKAVEKQTQTGEVLKYLKKHRSITSTEAFELFGATRLSSIIHKLRKRGYLINTVMCAGKNRYGTPLEYAKYTYIKYDGVDHTISVEKLRGDK